ncbi:peptide chain release factor 2 [Facklamia sp. P12945]|uniref:peptide chain release factor 2 n=1 Tax=unclassified Facklamia TaxID=2622293 RepID=UPI003D17CDC4
MEIYEIKDQIESAQLNIEKIRGSLDIDKLEADVAEMESKMLKEDFWDDNQAAQSLIQELNKCKLEKNSFYQLEEGLDDAMIGLELIEEGQDPELQKELEEKLVLLNKQIDDYQLSLLLSGDHDHLNAIMEIHPGAGGTESQDWGEMLLRMYERWASHNHYAITFIDYQNGDEAGIKSATFEVSGYKTYGHLKSEKGVHRLIRISPFDSNARRHTSFCSIDVTPMIDGSIELEVNPEDLRIDTYRASGAGGQHINKTSSAVRITHLPTGIVTQSQSNRSQIQNKEQAMSLLKAKLYQKEVEEKEAELQAIKGEQKDNAWGSQIRSYVFHPYSMVKDHRTNYETGNIDAVMDGELNPFIDAYLRWNIQEEK